MVEGKITASQWLTSYFPVEKNLVLINFGSGFGPQNIAYGKKAKNIVAVDISRRKLNTSKSNEARFGVHNCSHVNADVCSLPIKEKSFEKAIAVDIIEHVDDPLRFLAESRRVLKPNGELLLTVPTLHEFYKTISRFFGNILRALNLLEKLEVEHEDKHNQIMGIQTWIALIKNAGFEIEDSRASTLFPPLHWFGVPRFWFSNKFIRAMDDFLCKLPLFKYLGQACVFKLRVVR